MRSRFRANGATLVAMTAFAGSAFLFWHTFDPVYDTAFAAAGRGPVFFPRIILGLMIVLAAAVTLRSALAEGGAADRRGARPVLIAMALTAAYVFAITQVGYLFATLAYGMLLPLVFGDRNLLAIVGFAVGYAVATWFVFERVFLIILPKSPWFVAF